MFSITKKCRRCGGVKPISEFHRHKAHKDGYSNICGLCVNNSHYQYHLEHPEKQKEADRKYYLSHIEKVKAKAKRLYLKSADKQRASARLWNSQNQERYKDNKKRWKSEKPDKARIYARNRHAAKTTSKINNWSEEQERELKDSYLNRCVYCGRKVKLTIDHIAPLSRGGEHSIDNAAPACQSCNGSKNNKSLLLFLYYRIKNAFG